MAEAFLFVPTLAFTWVFGLMLAMYLSHSFLIIFEDSAAGAHRITWHFESIADLFWKVFWMAFLVLTWGLPAVLCALVAIKTDSRSTLLTALAFFWMLFPLGALSTRANNSPWMPLSAQLIYRLLQKIPALLLFYLVSAVPLAAFFCWLVLAIGRPCSVELIFLYSLLGAVGWVVYARVIGRLGYLLMFTKGFDFDAEKTEKQDETPRKKKRRVEPSDEEQPPSRVQPSEMEPLSGGLDGPVGGYNVIWEAAPEAKSESKPEKPKAKKPKPRWENGEPVVAADPWLGEVPLELPTRKRPVEEEEDDLLLAGLDDFDESDDGKPIRAAEVDSVTESVAETAKKQKRFEPKESEVLLYSKHRRGEQPKQAFDSSLLGLLGQGIIIKVMLTLYSGLWILAAVSQLLRGLRPGGGGLG